MHPLFDRATPHPSGYREVDAGLLAAHLPSSLTVLDVREPDELDGILGHIAGIRHAPLATVRDAVGAWPRDTDLVLVCRSGARSSSAATALAALGFSRVMNLQGGMLAWNTARLPVVRTAPHPLPTLSLVQDGLMDGLHRALRPPPHEGPTLPPMTNPSREALTAVLDALQAARPPGVRDIAAFERLLRMCRDQLAVARLESGS
ncbi:rhodanese-like domain-containing protein [Corallococcus macrosporus]|uniref:Rhodanese-like domain-containing protein n=1 Tax=Myxococcus fulvus (strain ATCC BAA-855 / HW-1) TaxID=483219 RepID=F8CE22_MYXFH|nr:rhodanese-like domain-containing protein [Corallococcus macrosporus]AEI63483.1 rhodanese-like domain-containing protein [Corallococcus macrosporus]